MTTQLAYARTAIPASDLPTEFLLFAPGINANFNADVKGEPQPIFTARSASRLREAAARKGSDYFVDLEHFSLKRQAPGATDAMAWFRLEVRPDGSCWAVNVRWTPEGERRLRALSQKYVSPVFYYEKATGEVTEFCGVALTSDPATYGAAPLVAAARKRKPIPAAVLSTKVPAVTRVAFGLLAMQHNVSPSALLRRLVERAHWLGGATSDRVATLARTPADLETLLDLLELDRDATPDQIVAAVEAFLESLPAGVPGSAAPDVPTDPTAGTADPPARDPVAAARHAMKLAAMDPVQRDRFLRATAAMARDRAAQQRPRGASARPFSPAVRAKLSTMTREQRQKFDAIVSNRRK